MLKVTLPRSAGQEAIRKWGLHPRRLDAKGVLHHIIVRGIEGRLIFRDDIDKDHFVERMEKVFIDTHTPLLRMGAPG